MATIKRTAIAPRSEPSGEGWCKPELLRIKAVLTLRSGAAMSTRIWKIIVGQNSAALRRPRGRPQVRPDEETLQLIVEAARQEFLASGYAATTMCAVAERAGTSTKTVYRLIPNKAELFKNVISTRIGQFMVLSSASAC